MLKLVSRILPFLFFVALSFCCFAQRDYTALVNPFIGTGGHGHTFPGASLPFGAMQLSPDTRVANWDGSSGYHYSDSVIYGFSHTHLSGTGVPDYCDVLLMPFAGEVVWDGASYRSPFRHSSEKALPGYYEVLLEKDNIKAQLTTALRSGMHQYTFPAGTENGNVLLDLTWRDEVLEGWIEKVSDHEIRGLRRSKSWAPNQYLYFCIQTEKPINDFSVQDDAGQVVEGGRVEGKKLKAFLSCALGGSPLKLKVGISAVNAEGAKLNLDTEIPHWDFEKVRNDARQAWNKELGKIDVKGGTDSQQTIFYTALYHTMLAPNVFGDAFGHYRGTDGKIRRATAGTNYTVFSLWDTYRAYHPLMTIINQKRTADWVSTFLRQYKQGGMLPVWELAGNETFCMIGYHSVPVMWDAVQKGIAGLDNKAILEAARSYAESDRFGLKPYRENGYIANNDEPESVSKTLEYAYDDWCIAQLAKAAGNDSVYRVYLRRAQSYKNLFDPSTKHMRGKLQSLWHTPFDPAEINNFFTEGNSWQYSFAVPQDIYGLMALHGGRKPFARKLNELFTTSAKTTGREQADVTGLIGQYAHGNEPSHHMAYLFAYTGQPGRTQELVRKICTAFYTTAPDGLIGNEDCGQMSAWYVLSAMGFYPVCPGNGEYVLGTPLFDEVAIRLENGRTFRIKARRRSANDFYVTGTTLNKQARTKSYLLHTDIIKGGEFVFNLAKAPSTGWGTMPADLPNSKIAEEMIVPVPFVLNETNKFNDSVRVRIGHVDSSAKISVQRGAASWMQNTRAFTQFTSEQITAAADVNGKQSQAIVQRFHKLPVDKSITIKSQVHPLYTAGGPEALIDGIEGTTNWRSNEWQSYFDTDFEAVIDLKAERPLTFLGVHVLQEVGPWILFPKEVVFFTSSDGQNFAEVARVQNNEGTNAGAQVQTMGVAVNLKARYVKVKAVNGGKLPAGHESAGSGSHLFIDEVILRSEAQPEVGKGSGRQIDDEDAFCIPTFDPAHLSLKLLAARFSPGHKECAPARQPVQSLVQKSLRPLPSSSR